MSLTAEAADDGDSHTARRTEIRTFARNQRITRKRIKSPRRDDDGRERRGKVPTPAAPSSDREPIGRFVVTRGHSPWRRPGDEMTREVLPRPEPSRLTVPSMTRSRGQRRLGRRSRLRSRTARRHRPGRPCGECRWWWVGARGEDYALLHRLVNLVPTPDEWTRLPTPSPSRAARIAYVKDREGLLFAAVRTVELPEKQRRVVGLVARGYSTKQIALTLGLSPGTVSAHRYAALRRLGLHGSVGLTHYAILKGLVQPGDVPGETGESD